MTPLDSIALLLGAESSWTERGGVYWLAAQGYNVIQVMMLHRPEMANPVAGPALVDGDLKRPRVTPGNDLTKPGEYDYWDHLDWVFDRAAARRLTAGTFGYWIGAPFARQGYMREAILALTHHAFTRMDLSRLEAACLPENAPSRGVLESCGFKYEGVAQSYLQINGRWRNHVLYANLRGDRRGRTDVG